jgi:hypothetical protein
MITGTTSLAISMVMRRSCVACCEKWDYRGDDGAFRHRDRRVIFVGDFVYRGPEQGEVLQIASSMCDAGAALVVMGNHEFNALGWAEPDGNGGFLRPHGQKNREQHEEFLCQIGEGSAAHNEALEWFQSLPFFWIHPGYVSCTPAGMFRLNRGSNDILIRRIGSPERVCAKPVARCSEAYEAAEILLKGPEALLPDGRSFKDKQPHLMAGVALYSAVCTCLRSHQYPPVPPPKKSELNSVVNCEHQPDEFDV